MDWPEFLVRLRSVSKERQKMFLLICIEGYTDPEVAVALGCDEDAARLRRESTMNLLQELSRSVLAPIGREPADEH